MVRVPLRDRTRTVVGYALVDDCDAYLVNMAWHLGEKGYVVHSRSRRAEGLNPVTVRMARMVMGLVPGDGLTVDHISGDKLDNRRGNLRIVTNAQNRQNLDTRPGAAAQLLRASVA